MAGSAAVFAQIVVDIPAQDIGDRLFTYRVPDYLLAETFVGAQVLVPFGQQELVAGYVVALNDVAPANIALKDIAEVLDGDPLFDSAYIDFLYWIADYYCASLASVIAAAVPSDLGPRLKRVVETTVDAVEEVMAGELRHDACVRAIMVTLSSSATYSLSIKTLRQRSRLKQAQFYKTIALLRQQNFIKIQSESTMGTAPKTVNVVIWTGKEGITKKQVAIVSVLRRTGGQMVLPHLLEVAATTRGTISKMVNDGIVLVSAEEVMRDPMKNVPTDAPNSIPELTEQQRQVLSVLSGELSKHLDAARPEQVVSVGARALAMVPAGTVTEKVDYRETHKQTAGNEVIPWLLHGVTGSGKTEIYLRLIDQTLKAGRTALLLVPEISLTPQLAQRLKSRFGGKAAVWHSALSAGERYDTWRRLRSGDVRVLLGARSAVLASMPELALIVVDEEHDGSYKQASPSPRYNAKQLVLEKAKRTGALVVLGSATPDVATFYEADRNNRILELPERVFKQEMPRVSVVDMRDEFANNNRGIFSLLLKQRLAACLERKEQAILLMNRRGFASHVFCRACGYVVKCRNCSVSLVFHQPGGEESSYLSCHHCGYHCSSVQICPSCKSPFLKHYGLGTQRVEQEVQKFFPEASHLRLDSDVTVKKGAYQQVLGKFAQGDADILIGTQMVAKGLDISNVTLVGVLAADAAFNLPDYRSLERGFQLLTQVSGRAGRGDRPGTVVLQTFNTDLPALNWARKHDYASFYAEEITARTELGYPPFSQITRCVVSGPDPISVQRSCEELAEQLTHYLEEEVDPHLVTILGPAPCLIERMRGNYRYHLLIKNFAGDAGHRLITTFLRTKRVGQNNSLAVDVDAFDLL